MKTYTKIFSVLIIIASLFLIPVFAHPGRTDANGGHWDRKEGTYHFHTGEYAGRGSSGSSSSSEYVPFTPPYDPPTENPYKNTEETSKSDSNVIENVLGIVGIGIFASPFVFTLGSFIFAYIDSILEMHSPKRNLKKYDKLLTDTISLKNELETQRVQLEKGFPNCIPPEYEIGRDNLPKEKNSTGWGKTFTVYKTASGNKIHCKRKCCNATVERHIFKYYHLDNFTSILCKTCCKQYNFPSLDWYDSYLEYKSLPAKHTSTKCKYSEICAKLFDQHNKCNTASQLFWIKFSKKNRRKLNNLNEVYYTLNTNDDDYITNMSI